MFRLLLGILLLTGLFSCVEIERTVDLKKTEAHPPVILHLQRVDGVLEMDVAIPDREWSYTSLLSNDGMEYSLVVRDTLSKPQPLEKIDIIRPVKSYTTAEYPSGFKLVFKLVNRHKLQTSKSDIGLNIRLTPLEPDMEMLAMSTFGAWADPLTPASSFQGVDNEGRVSVIHFDSEPVFSTGKAGGRFYLDIFGVSILPGIVKQKDIKAVNQLLGKTRFIFDAPIGICAEERTLTIGKSCKAYGALSGFSREKNDVTESFLFNLPGRPEAKVVEKKGLTAFGFTDTQLFSRVFQRFADGDVYKVEAREQGGYLWLIFLHSDDLKYRKYYSGDKFFVVFYRS